MNYVPRPTQNHKANPKAKLQGLADRLKAKLAKKKK